MHGAWTRCNNKMRQTRDGKEKESGPDKLCAEPTVVRKRYRISLKQIKS